MPWVPKVAEMTMVLQDRYCRISRDSILTISGTLKRSCICQDASQKPDQPHH